LRRRTKQPRVACLSRRARIYALLAEALLDQRGIPEDSVVFLRGGNQLDRAIQKLEFFGHAIAIESRHVQNNINARAA
jgi:hypothetical protein